MHGVGRGIPCRPHPLFWKTKMVATVNRDLFKKAVRDYSKRSVALYLGISRPTLYKILNDKHQPHAALIEQINTRLETFFKNLAA
jgi:transcriptional regulator with XRE-family HTH domain